MNGEDRCWGTIVVGFWGGRWEYIWKLEVFVFMGATLFGSSGQEAAVGADIGGLVDGSQTTVERGV